MNNSDQQDVKEMSGDKLIDLTVEVYARSLAYPQSEKLHNRAFECVAEVKRRLESNSTLERECEALKAALDTSKQQELAAYGGIAYLAWCGKCQKPYPEFSCSSHLYCWDCRKAQPTGADEREGDGK